tara:strand:- start:2176 stop:2988 length:813 start_codon:yes stop_codon:yes gene_type:complete
MFDLSTKVEKWINSHLDKKILDLGIEKYQVVPILNDPFIGKPIWVIKYKQSTIIFSDKKWVSDFENLIEHLDKEMLFSIYGSYELAKLTKRSKFKINGPSYYLFGDKDKCNLEVDPRVFIASKEELESVDRDIFWHCYFDDAVSGFAVKNKGEISALATVVDKGESVYEIGMEVERSSQGLGMGRAVVNAAVQWILDKGCIPLATVGPFNVPSARTLRSVGLSYYMTDMTGEPGDFVIPPQALGAPVKNMDIYNLYPDWAMNKMIKPKKS